MKKLFLTMAVVAFTTLFASAQFLVVTTYTAAEDGAEWEVTSLTDNLGIGYAVNDAWTVGFIKAGEDSLGDTSYDLWGRYNWNENVYVSVQAPTEDTMDNLNIGVGYSLNVWKGLNVEPNYSMGLEGDEGAFNLGLSYKF